MLRRRRAIILLLTLEVIGAMVFWGALFLDLTGGYAVNVARDSDRVLAIDAADAGIDDALYQLYLDRTWRAGLEDQALDSGATYSVTIGTRPLPAGWVDLVSGGRCRSSRQGAEALVDCSGATPTVMARW